MKIQTERDAVQQQSRALQPRSYQVSNLTGGEPTPPFLAKDTVSFLEITIQEFFEDGSRLSVTLEDPLTGEQTDCLDAETVFLSSISMQGDAGRGEVVSVAVTGKFSKERLRIHRDGARKEDLAVIEREFRAAIHSPKAGDGTLILAKSSTGIGYAVGAFSFIPVADEG